MKNEVYITGEGKKFARCPICDKIIRDDEEGAVVGEGQLVGSAVVHNECTEPPDGQKDLSEYHP